MAEVAELPTSRKEEADRLPRGRGRPPNTARPPRGADLREGHDKSLLIVPFLDLWCKLHGEHPARFLVYVWRNFPEVLLDIVDPATGKKDPKYIDILSEPMSLESLESRYGAGEYKLILNDKDGGGKQGKEVAICNPFKVEKPWDDYPPKLKLSTLKDSSRNHQFRIWAQVSGKYEMTPHQQPSSEAATVGALVNMIERLIASVQKGQVPDTSANKMAEMFSQASSKAIDIAFAQVKEKSPEETLKLVASIQGAFKRDEFGIKEVLALVEKLKSETGNNVQTEFLLKRLEALEASNLSLQNRLFDKLSEKPPTPPESEFQKSIVGKFMERALDMLDGNLVGRASREKWWEIALHHPQVQELAGGLTQAAINLSQAFLISRGGKPGPVVNRQPSAADILQGLPPGTQPAPANTNPADPPNEADAVTQTLSNFFNIEKFRSMMFHLNTGLPGQEFAVWCANGGMSLADHAQIKAIGRDKILETIRATPIAWNVIRPIEQQFSKFLDEFLSWTPEWIPDEGPGA